MTFTDESDAPRMTPPGEAAPANADVAPMTGSLLARLFVVPAILVSILVVGLMVVVVLFGWSGIGQRPTVAELVAQLEAASGQRQAGVLFPGDKEVWLAAQELARRLERVDEELRPEELAPTAARLSAIYETLAAAPDAAEPFAGGVHPKAVFVLLALGRLPTEGAVQTLRGALDSPQAVFRQSALQGLANLRSQTGVAAASPRVIELLDDPSAEVRLIACAALGQVAPPGDPAAVEALARQLDASDEMQWNAALALARLGSSRGKLVLMSMMDREYWNLRRVCFTDESGTAVERPFGPGQVDAYMTAALEAASRLDDAELMEAVRKVSRDRGASPAVRDRAFKALRRSAGPSGALPVRDGDGTRITRRAA